MNLGEANIVVRARSTRESLDLTFPFILRLGGKRYAWLAAGCVLLCGALCFAVWHGLRLKWSSIWFLAVPAAIWTQGIFTLAAGELMFARELVIANVLRKFARRALPYTVALVLTRSLIALSTLTVVFAPLVWGRFLFLPEAMLLEGAPLRQGLSRAGRLASGQKNSLLELELWLLAVSAFMVLASESLGKVVVDYTLQLSLPVGSLYNERGSLYALLGLLAAVPITATLRFLAYIDGRARRDAWDVQIKLQRIVQREAESQ